MGGGAVVGGVVALAAEPTDVAGVADEHAGHDRTDSEQLGEGRARGGDGGGDSALRLHHLGVEAAEIVEMLHGKGVAGQGDGTGGVDIGEEPFGAGSIDFIRDSTGNEFGQEGMEATSGPVPGPTQIDVALRQQAQHTHMVRSVDRDHLRRAERRHGHGPGVVGVVLLRPTAAQQPDPRRQRGGHVDHGLPGGQELLGEQITQPAGRLHRPRPLLELGRPPKKLLRLTASRSDPEPGQFRLGLVDGHRGVRPLVGIDADHHPHAVLLDRE